MKFKIKVKLIEVHFTLTVHVIIILTPVQKQEAE